MSCFPEGTTHRADRHRRCAHPRRDRRAAGPVDGAPIHLRLRSAQYPLPHRTQAQPKTQLLRFLKEEHPDDAGIIYCLSRKRTEEVAAWLQGEGYNALPYHAGLPADTRADHQARFLREEAVIMVATIAFGMGIDKPDVRFVAHLDLPKTVESYYQETGRAGRDGEPADAWMVYGLQDVIKLRQMMENSDGSEEHKRAEQHRLNAITLPGMFANWPRRWAIVPAMSANPPRHSASLPAKVETVSNFASNVGTFAEASGRFASKE